MQNTGFRKLTFEEAKLKASNKPKKVPTRKVKSKKDKLPSLTKLKDKLWKVIGVKIRARDKNICFTSGKEVYGSNCHVGHGIPSSVGGVLLRFHPYNLHVQSYVENIHYSGNGGEYYRRQLAKYGQEKLDKLYELKKHSVQADRYFYNSLTNLWELGTEEEVVQWLEDYAGVYKNL